MDGIFKYSIGLCLKFAVSRIYAKHSLCYYSVRFNSNVFLINAKNHFPKPDLGSAFYDPVFTQSFVIIPIRHVTWLTQSDIKILEQKACQICFLISEYLWFNFNLGVLPNSGVIVPELQVKVTFTEGRILKRIENISTF
jgi:hypothetical protein